MKRKALCVILTILIAFSTSIVASAQAKAQSDYTNKTYTHQGKFDDAELLHGIDVSEHNGSIDFKRVKNDGIDFVFVRVGYTGYTKSRLSLNYDKNYKTNIDSAIKAGLRVGVYWYSQAVTTSDAVREANKLLSAIKGYELTMPVVFDYEFACVSSGRLDSANLSKEKMTQNAFAFLDRISEQGYDACIYANKSFLTDNVNALELASMYKVWLAHYTTNTDYSGDYEFWQYSSSGKVSGVSGNCDVNFWYYRDVTDLGSYTYTGGEIEPQPQIKIGKKTLKLNQDYKLKYKNNIEAGIGKITATGINSYEGSEWSFTFKIIPSAPTGLTLDSRTTTSLTYFFNGVKGASSYKLKITNKTTNTTFYQTSKSKTVTISNLTPANEYSVKVCAGIKNSNGVTVYGKYSSANVKHALPSRVTGVSATKASTSSITLKWDKLAGADGYIVYRSYTSGKCEQIAQLNGSSETSYTVSNLKSGKTYRFKVCAYIEDSKKKLGTLSQELKASTKPSSIALKSATSKKSKKINLKWESTTCSGYEVEWSTTSDFSSNKKAVKFSSTATSGTITTAQSNKKYYVRIRAYKLTNKTYSYSSWSSPLSVKVV